MSCWAWKQGVLVGPIKRDTMQLHTDCARRSHRARITFHRSNCRWADDTEGEHSSAQEWDHRDIYTRNSTGSKEKRLESACAFHGLLQPHIELWRGKNAQRCS